MESFQKFFENTEEQLMLAVLGQKTNKSRITPLLIFADYLQENDKECEGLLIRLLATKTIKQKNDKIEIITNNTDLEGNILITTEENELIKNHETNYNNKISMHFKLEANFDTKRKWSNKLTWSKFSIYDRWTIVPDEEVPEPIRTSTTNLLNSIVAEHDEHFGVGKSNVKNFYNGFGYQKIPVKFWGTYQNEKGRKFKVFGAVLNQFSDSVRIEPVDGGKIKFVNKGELTKKYKKIN